MQTLTFPKTWQLLFFKSLNEHPVIQKFTSLKSAQTSDATKEFETIYFDIKSEVLNLAMETNDTTACSSTPWEHFILSEILSNENTLTLHMENGMIEPQHPLMKNFLEEMTLLSALLTFNWKEFLSDTLLDQDFILADSIFHPSERRKKLSDTFVSGSPKDIFTGLNQYILKNGLGIFERSQSFRIYHHHLIPVGRNKMLSMNDLIGYEAQKKALMENTSAFVSKKLGLNCLLQGDMGTGKSTMVKALLHEFSDYQLKMVEIKRNQLPALQEIISLLSKRPYPFIIFVDDLSFDENDEDFMLFKNCLEGSLEDSPDNIRIYATSNKRHLITETRSERDDAIHARDIIQEKLSLSARFGLIINFSTPDQKEYLNIVSELAKSSGLKIEEEKLNTLALQWEIRHLNRSGRTAEQLIKSLLS